MAQKKSEGVSRSLQERTGESRSPATPSQRSRSWSWSQPHSLAPTAPTGTSILTDALQKTYAVEPVDHLPPLPTHANIAATCHLQLGRYPWQQAAGSSKRDPSAKKGHGVMSEQNPKSTESGRSADSPEAPTQPPCPNCDAPGTGGFCSRCGQNIRHARLDIRSIVGPFLDDVFDLNLPILRTAKDMTTRPGAVCLDYVAGRRKRYTGPLKYCFLCAALFAGIIVLFDINFVQVRMQQMTNFVPTEIQPADDTQAGQIAATIPELVETIQNNIHIITMLISPVTALGLMLAYRKSGYNFAEHYVFVLFTLGHLFAAKSLLALLGVYAYGAASLATLPLELAFVTWAAIAFYRASVFVTAIKIILVEVLTRIAVGIFVMGSVVIILLARYLF